jgi:hypothetical protein
VNQHFIFILGGARPPKAQGRRTVLFCLLFARREGEVEDCGGRQAAMALAGGRDCTVIGDTAGAAPRRAAVALPAAGAWSGPNMGHVGRDCVCQERSLQPGGGFCVGAAVPLQDCWLLASSPAAVPDPVLGRLLHSRLVAWGLLAWPE